MQPQLSSSPESGLYSFSSLKNIAERRGPASQHSGHASEMDATISEIAKLSIFDCEINTYGTNFGLIAVRMIAQNVYPMNQPASTFLPKEDEIKTVSAGVACMKLV